MASYGDLFRFLEERISIDVGTMRVEGCDNTLSLTKAFCEQHKLDFSKVHERLESTGGHCDCEVLLNSMENIPRDDIMPRDWDRLVRAGGKGEPSIVIETS